MSVRLLVGLHGVFLLRCGSIRPLHRSTHRRAAASGQFPATTRFRLVAAITFPDRPTSLIRPPFALFFFSLFFSSLHTTDHHHQLHHHPIHRSAACPLTLPTQPPTPVVSHVNVGRAGSAAPGGLKPHPQAAGRWIGGSQLSPRFSPSLTLMWQGQLHRPKSRNSAEREPCQGRSRPTPSGVDRARARRFNRS